MGELKIRNVKILEKFIFELLFHKFSRLKSEIIEYIGHKREKKDIFVDSIDNFRKEIYFYIKGVKDASVFRVVQMLQG